MLLIRNMNIKFQLLSCCMALMFPLTGICVNKVEVCAYDMSKSISLNVKHAFFRFTLNDEEIETTGYNYSGVVKNSYLGVQANCREVESFNNAQEARTYWLNLSAFMEDKGRVPYDLVYNNCSNVAARVLEELDKHDLSTWIKNQNITREKLEVKTLKEMDDRDYNPSLGKRFSDIVIKSAADTVSVTTAVTCITVNHLNNVNNGNNRNSKKCLIM